ncbi:hypothetical protein ACQPW3_07985 [Actinosynnema sp. CA-248983]
MSADRSITHVLSAADLEAARAAGRQAVFTQAQKDRLRDIFRPLLARMTGDD